MTDTASEGQETAAPEARVATAPRARLALAVVGWALIAIGVGAALFLTFVVIEDAPSPTELPLVLLVFGVPALLLAAAGAGTLWARRRLTAPPAPAEAAMEPSVAALTRQLRARARTYKSLAILTLLLGLAALGIGFYVFVSADTLAGSPEQGVQAARRDLEEDRRRVGRAIARLGQGLETDRIAADDLARRLLSPREYNFLTSPEFDLAVAEPAGEGSNERVSVEPRRIREEYLRMFADCVRVQEDSGLRFSATKEEMVTTALDCRLAETREEVVDTLARSVLGGGVIDGSSSAAEFSDGFERSLLGYETSLRRLETEIGRVSAADAARRFDANWVSEIVTRIGSLAFIFFTVQYLGARYLHLARQGAFLDGCADGIELVCLEYEGEARRERLDRFVAGLLDREPTEEKVQSALDRLAEMAERVAVAATEAESRRGGDAEAGARTAAAPAPRRSWLARLAGRG